MTSSVPLPDLHSLDPATLRDPDAYLSEKRDWVAQQLADIDAAGDTTAVTLSERPIVVVTTRGARSGRLRRVPLMRVEHEGSYLAVASKGGAPAHPAWYHNICAHPQVFVQDGTDIVPRTARELPEGIERDRWWERAVAAFPTYTEYQEKTARLIPVFVLEPPTA